MNGLLVANLTDISSNMRPSMLYVAISRCRELSQLFFLTVPSKDECQNYYKPKTELKFELTRQEAVAFNTLIRALTDELFPRMVPSLNLMLSEFQHRINHDAVRIADEERNQPIAIPDWTRRSEPFFQTPVTSRRARANASRGTTRPRPAATPGYNDEPAARRQAPTGNNETRRNLFPATSAALSSQTPPPSVQPYTYSNTFVPICAAIVGRPHLKTDTCRHGFGPERFDALVIEIREAHRLLRTPYAQWEWRNNYLHRDLQEKLLFVNEAHAVNLAVVANEGLQYDVIMARLQQNEPRPEWAVMNQEFLLELNLYLQWCAQNNNRI